VTISGVSFSADKRYSFVGLTNLAMSAEIYALQPMEHCQLRKDNNSLFGIYKLFENSVPMLG